MVNHSKSFGILLILLCALLVPISSSPLMIEEKDEFLEKIRTKDIAIVFYGSNDTPEYQSFEQLIPSYNQLFEGLQFLYVPSSKFKLNRPNPSLSIYRNIGGGDWEIYKGSFDRAEMDKWIQHHSRDPLQELKIEQLESIFRNGEKSFIVLSYGQFELIRSKIYVHDFCNFKKLKCWKVQTTSPIYSTVTKLLGISKQDFGISKLAFYSPAVEHLQLYTKDVWKLRSKILLIQGNNCLKCTKEGRESSTLIPMSKEKSKFSYTMMKLPINSLIYDFISTLII